MQKSGLFSCTPGWDTDLCPVLNESLIYFCTEGKISKIVSFSEQAAAGHIKDVRVFCH